MKTKHTNLPWCAKQPGHKGMVSGIIRDKYNRFVANTNIPQSGEDIRDENEISQNAEFIVKACNCHADLLEALKIASVYARIVYGSEASKNQKNDIDIIQSAIKRATK